MDDLKQCNRWFIDAFGDAGEKVELITDNFDEIFSGIIE
jgi:hypothetical protein